MLSFDDALKSLLDAALPVVEIRQLPLEACVGRVLAAAQLARVNVPSLDNSAMDGYAVRCQEIAAALASGQGLPVSQRIPAGTVGEPLQPGSVARIFTGAPVPPGADAVLMQEECTVIQDSAWVRFARAPRSGENIRRIGEDMRSGAEILPMGVRLRAQEVALAAAGGLAQLPVYRRLRVALLLTGSELVEPVQPLPPGGVYDSNRYALRGQLEALGCEVRVAGHVSDNFEATRAALLELAANNDLVISSGGVSVGEEDHVKAAVESIGQLAMWKVAIKPGKPLAFGEINGAAKRAWFVGLPGNPVSSFITFATLVRPFILKLQGVAQVAPRRFLLPAGFARKGDALRTEFLRARLDAEGRLELFANQSSAVVTSLTWSDGLVHLPPGHSVNPGDLLSFIPFSEMN